MTELKDLLAEKRRLQDEIDAIRMEMIDPLQKKINLIDNQIGGNKKHNTAGRVKNTMSRMKNKAFDKKEKEKFKKKKRKNVVQQNN